jgi:hypothetical protein
VLLENFSGSKKNNRACVARDSRKICPSHPSLRQNLHLYAMQRLFAWLRSPYPLDMDAARQFRQGLYYGLFVWLFLYAFRPFGLGEYQGNLLLYTVQAGLLTGILIPVLNLAAVAVLPRLFSEEGWTVGRALLWSLTFTGLLGLVNALHAEWWFGGNLHGGDILRFEAYTLGIGLFPIGISLLIRQRHFVQVHGVESAQMEALLHPAAPAVDASVAVSAATVQLPNGKEVLSLPVAELHYLRAADNYIEVYQVSGGKVQRHVLRATLGEAEARLAEFPGWCRCHKSYLVQLGHVAHVTGNAQGCQLHLQGDLPSIPVSRNRMEEVRQRLAAVMGVRG